MPSVLNVEVTVVGGGPAGLITTLLLGSAGLSAALIAPPSPPDTRTTALMQGSLLILERIGIWPDLAPKSGALRKLRIVDDSRSLIRAPETLFDAAELGLTAFGHNIVNSDLLGALHTRIGELTNIAVFSSPATAIEPRPDAVQVRLADGREITSRLVVGADGRRSICREAVGIKARTWDYEQAALTLNLAHTRPHQSVSTEFHRRHGPMVLVPLPGDRSSIVLVDTIAEVKRLLALDDAALGRELEKLTHGLLGRITPALERGHRPLGGLSVDRFAANRVALVGESAHILPPIGAQGLNLGIRDGAEIADAAIGALGRGMDPGAPALLAAYDRARRADASPRILAVDLLNRSLLADFLPFDIARAAGLCALHALPPLRREVMRRGVALPS